MNIHDPTNLYFCKELLFAKVGICSTKELYDFIADEGTGQILM